MPDSYEVRHFSLVLPAGRDRSDVPALLRHLADTLAQFGPVEVQDIVLGGEATPNGFEYRATVYFHPNDDGIGG
jgi:hypothetical protein